MPTMDTIFKLIRSGTQDQNIKFRDLQRLLDALGFSHKENNGDHFLYNYPGIKELINIQPDKKDHSKAKSYQVKQVRNFLKWNNISMEE